MWLHRGAVERQKNIKIYGISCTYIFTSENIFFALVRVLILCTEQKKNCAFLLMTCKFSLKFMKICLIKDEIHEQQVLTAIFKQLFHREVSQTHFHNCYPRGR